MGCVATNDPGQAVDNGQLVVTMADHQRQAQAVGRGHIGELAVKADAHRGDRRQGVGIENAQVTSGEAGHVDPAVHRVHGHAPR